MESWGSFYSKGPGPRVRESTMKPVGKPDARNGHVRFAERGWETGRPVASVPAPILDSTGVGLEPRWWHGLQSSWKAQNAKFQCKNKAASRRVFSERSFTRRRLGRRPSGHAGSCREMEPRLRLPGGVQSSEWNRDEKPAMEIACYHELQRLLWRTACAEVRPCFDKRPPGSFS